MKKSEVIEFFGGTAATAQALRMTPSGVRSIRENRTGLVNETFGLRVIGAAIRARGIHATRTQWPKFFEADHMRVSDAIDIVWQSSPYEVPEEAIENGVLAMVEKKSHREPMLVWPTLDFYLLNATGAPTGYNWSDVVCFTYRSDLEIFAAAMMASAE